MLSHTPETKTNRFSRPKWFRSWNSVLWGNNSGIAKVKLFPNFPEIVAIDFDKKVNLLNSATFRSRICKYFWLIYILLGELCQAEKEMPFHCGSMILFYIIIIWTKTIRNTQRQIQRNNHWKIVYFHICILLLYTCLLYDLPACVCGIIDTCAYGSSFHFDEKTRTHTHIYISNVCIRNVRQCR